MWQMKYPALPRYTPYVLILVLFGLGLRAIMMMRTTTSLFATFVPDDAAYYFVIARNLADGHGLVFVPGINSNGFHPLWLFLITPFFLFFSDDSALRLSIFLGAFFSLGAAVLWFEAFRRSGIRWTAALFAVAFIFWHPHGVLLSLDGLETALADFCAAATILLAIHLRQGGPKSPAILGGALALTVLARMDYVFFAAILTTIWLLVYRRERLVKDAGILGATFLLGISPWLAYNLWLTGSIMPTSGSAYPYVIKQNVLAWNPAMTATDFLVTSLNNGIISIRWGFGYILPWLGALGFIFILLALALFSRIEKNKQNDTLTAGLLPLAIVLGSLVSLFYHGAARWYPRHWYIFPLITGTGLVIAMLMDRIESRWKTGARLAMVLLAIAMVWYSISELRSVSETGMSSWQAELVEAGRKIANMTEADEPIGAVNAGILAFVSGRPVHELGGVVNHQAFEALRNKKLGDYLDTHGIRLLVDYDYSLLNQYARYFGEGFLKRLELVERVDLPVRPWGEGGDAVSIYRIRPKPSSESATQ